MQECRVLCHNCGLRFKPKWVDELVVHVRKTPRPKILRPVSRNFWVRGFRAPDRRRNKDNAAQAKNMGLQVRQKCEMKAGFKKVGETSIFEKITLC